MKTSAVRRWMLTSEDCHLLGEHDERLALGLGPPLDQDPDPDRDAARDLHPVQMLGEQQHREQDGEERLEVRKQRGARGAAAASP